MSLEVADMAVVGVGWYVAEKLPEGASYWPRAGVCFDARSYDDHETGERVTVFSVLGMGDASKPTGKLKLHHLHSDSIAEALEPNSGLITPYLNAILAELHRTKQLTPRRAELSAIYCRLMRCVA